MDGYMVLSLRGCVKNNNVRSKQQLLSGHCIEPSYHGGLMTARLWSQCAVIEVVTGHRDMMALQHKYFDMANR